MNIVYIITILSVYILFILLHKTEKKQNAITWLGISAILILCYNILICLILTFLGMLCTLGNLSICNFLVSLVLAAILTKSKKIQKYYIKAQDMVFSILLLILVIFIAYKQYGFPFNIKYQITDGSSHFFFAQQFYENSTLLFNETTDDILGVYNSSFRLPGAYINEGILFKVFDGIIHQIDLFILFDICILYLSGILFYQLLKIHSKEDKKLNVLAMIFSIIYMLGYQLNSMLYGYVYLSLALDIIIAFLLLMANCEKETISNAITLPTLALVSLGIFFSYAYFIPIIYIATITNIIIKSIKEKEKIVSTSNVTILMYVIIIPLILGVFYFIIFPLANGMNTEISTIGTEGEIYENYITNYLPFIPIFIGGIILLIKNKEKNKENSLERILFILSIIFAIILWIGNKFEIVSEYYFFKSYYIIWILAIYNVYLALTYILSEKNKTLKTITYIYTVIYVLIIFTALTLNKNIWINDIFYINKNCIINEKEILKREELNILEKAENSIEGNQIYILTPEHKGRADWVSVLYHNQSVYIDWITGYTITIEKWLSDEEEKYYLAYHEDYAQIEANANYLEEDSSEYRIIHNDEYGFILERK